jgi:uncharacterized membrane protein YtjA (UPF0391 family)
MGLLHWALIFLVVALIAALLGFAGIAAAAAGIARILFVMLSEAKHLGGEWNQRLFSLLGPDPSLALRACPERSRRDDRRDDTDPTKRTRTPDTAGQHFDLTILSRYGIVEGLPSGLFDAWRSRP